MKHSVETVKKDPSRRPLEGVLLVDKPPGPTSHDMVREVRRILEIRRVGHTGTLDPFASGLLLVCVGRATRLAEYFHILPKTYRAAAVLGVRTDTDDRTGRITQTSEAWRGVTLNAVRRAAEQLVGQSEQVPPAFSAKRVDGRRAYELSRGGAEVHLEPASVVVHRVEVASLTGPRVELEAEVSTGTYLRALARDLGTILGCHAHLSELRRTAVGTFHVDDAVTPAQLEAANGLPRSWMTPARALAWLPARRLSAPEVVRITVGQPVPSSAATDGSDLPVRLLAGDRLVAVARAVGGELRPEKVFPGG